jgi:putative membrane protein
MRKIFYNSLLMVGLGCLGVGIPLAYSQAPGAGPPSGSQPGSQPSARPGGPDSGMNGPGMNNPDTLTTKKIDDKKFVKDAAIGGLTEVELGKLAVQKASSEDVKKFGQKMVDDHSKANDQLKEVAGKQNIAIPEALDSKHQGRVDKLAKLSGPDFDKAYIKDQLKDHQQDVSAFQSEAQSGTDPNIKQFAAQTLPTLQEHLSMVKDLHKNSK